MNENNLKLELGRYSDAELLELADGDAQGGSWSPAITSALVSWVTVETCPTSACTSQC
jgi:hypothetical protein